MSQSEAGAVTIERNQRAVNRAELLGIGLVIGGSGVMFPFLLVMLRIPFGYAYSDFLGFDLFCGLTWIGYGSFIAGCILMLHDNHRVLKPIAILLLILIHIAAILSVLWSIVSYFQLDYYLFRLF